MGNKLTEEINITSLTNDQSVLLEKFGELLTDYRSVDFGTKTNPVDAFFAYRLLLNRNPALGVELETLVRIGSTTWREFINELLASQEFSSVLNYLPSGLRLMSQVNGHRFWFDSEDREMGARMAAGVYEPETVALLKKIVHTGMNCLDIGAQTGFYTCLMADLVGTRGHVTAFEPMERCFGLLKKNVSENSWTERVTMHHSACAQDTGEISVDVASGIVVASPSGNHTIPSIKLDDLQLPEVGFIKIDIEGHEPSAIRGMEKLLMRDSPVLLTEFNAHWLIQAGSSVSEYASLLRSYGYTLFDCDQGLTIVHEFDMSNRLLNCNVLALKKDRADKFLERLRT